MSQTISKDQLNGFRVVADACAAAFLAPPDDGLVAGVRDVAHALDQDGFDDQQADAALTQRFHDRFLVPVSPVYVPLYEDSVRSGAAGEDGVFRFGGVEGRHMDHVVACYDAVGFDWHRVATGEGAAALLNVRPTSFAVELAFMAALAAQAVEESDEAVAQRSVELLREFAALHPGKWFARVAEVMRAQDDDFYARVCTLAAQAVASLG